MQDRRAVGWNVGRMLLVFAAGLIILAYPLVAGAQDAMPRLQAADGKPLEFEVVSVRANASGSQSSNFISPPASDGITIVNMPLQAIIEWAYGISIESQFAGVPGWASNQRFDISAKVADADLAAFRSVVDPVERTPMLQKILKDRFKMTCHYETRQLPAYALVVAKDGPRMSEIQPAIGPNGMKEGGGREVRRGEIKSFGMPMLPLARQLSKELGRVVVDQTGLHGFYNFTLKWAPDDGAASPSAGSGVPVSASGPSIFTAVQEQLGLKLKATKAALPVLVIDHIELPVEN